jgi:hypothetical protein
VILSLSSLLCFWEGNAGLFIHEGISLHSISSRLKKQTDPGRRAKYRTLGQESRQDSVSLPGLLLSDRPLSVSLFQSSSTPLVNLIPLPQNSSASCRCSSWFTSRQLLLAPHPLNRSHNRFLLLHRRRLLRYTRFPNDSCGARITRVTNRPSPPNLWS